MDNLKEISKMTFDPKGWFIGFRTWTLKAYDEYNNIICTVDKSEKHNYLLYVRFIITLKQYGYKLRECDRQQLKSGEKNFLIKSFISQARSSDFYEIGLMAGYSKLEINNIKNASIEEQHTFAEKVGLEFDELINNIHKL